MADRLPGGAFLGPVCFAFLLGGSLALAGFTARLPAVAWAGGGVAAFVCLFARQAWPYVPIPILLLVAAAWLQARHRRAPPAPTAWAPAPAALRTLPFQEPRHPSGGMDTQGARAMEPLGVRAVLFDLDTALVDLVGMKRAASDAAARAMLAAGADFPFSADEAGDVLFGDYLPDLESDTVFEAFLRKHHRRALGLGQHQVDRITAAAVNAYLRAKMLRTEPFPGVRPTLVALARAGLQLGVVTDAPRFKAYQRLDAAGLLDFFSLVVAAPGQGEGPPDGRPARAALGLLGLPPHHVLVVGDGPDGGLAGARAAGMRTAWARYGRPGAPVPLEAAVVLERVEELIQRIPLAGERR